MTKYEFINKLQESLSGNLSPQQLQENIQYYDEYITSEVCGGRSEAEVIEELGDPWAIAKNILAAEEMKGEADDEYAYDPDRHRDGSGGQRQAKVKVVGISKWQMVLLILGLIGILLLIVTVIGGIIALIVPFIIPIVVIIFVIRFIGNFRKK